MKHNERPTGSNIEFMDVYPINDNISRCEIKVFYAGRNRNYSYISKPVGERIAATIPGSPIVGLFNKEINDFEDHAQELVFEDGDIKWKSHTVPYGFIDLNSPLVWKEFESPTGEIREYAIAQGYLWTGRYPELLDVKNFGKSHSMEFFPESIKGEWAKFDNDDREFFIIDEAEISGLCILGDDYEPAFEGSTITTPELLYSMTKKENFSAMFGEFIKQVDEALYSKQGGQSEMSKKKIDTEFENTDTETSTENINSTETTTEETFSTEETTTEETFSTEETTTEETFSTEETTTEETFSTEETTTEETFSTKEVEQSDFELIKKELEDLKDAFELKKNEFEDMKIKYDLLVENQLSRENVAKDALIEKFSILGDKIDEIKEKKTQYSLEELDEKLSSLAFKHGVNFSAIEVEKDSIVVVKTQQQAPDSIPNWLKAVEKHNKN